MPGKKKLDEEYQKISKEEIQEEIKKEEKKKVTMQHELLKFRLRKFKSDLLFLFIMTLILGFILWSWKPELFSYTKALALGLAWYLIFEELQLHRMFKK